MDEQLSLLGGMIPPLPAPLPPKKSKKPMTPHIPPPSSSFVSPVSSPSLPQTPKREHRTVSPEIFYTKIIEGLRKYFQDHRMKKGVVGVSGGVDSALTLKLAVDALGAESVIAVIMPELGLTKQENIDHAKMLAAYLGVASHYQPINGFLTDYKLTPWKLNATALMNVKARIRMTLLYSVANVENALVLGTSNRSELLLGYMTKFGDSACDIEVIGSLYKTEVVALADYVGLPPEIVNKTPSAELVAGQTDEGELGASYEDLDKVLMKFDLGANGCIEHGMPVNLVHQVFRLVEKNKHKSGSPYVIPIQRK